MVEDAAGRSGVSIRLEAGVCPGDELAWQDAFCAQHDVMATSIDDEISPSVRRSALVDRLAKELRGHPLAARGDDPFAGRFNPWLDHTLVYPSGSLDVRLDAEQIHFLSATFTPSDPIRTCLAINATSPDLFVLASSYGDFVHDEARRTLACSEELHRQDAYGQTPLYYAVAADDPVAVRDFLSAGARPHHRADGRWTPIMMAARDTNEPQVVAALLEHGADPNAHTDEEPRRNALALARQNETLQETTVLLQMAIVGIQRASGRAEAQSINVVDRGAAPFLSPMPAPSDTEVVVYDMEVTLDVDAIGRVLEGTPAPMERFSARFEVRVSAVELRLPFGRSGDRHVAVISYVQDVEVNSQGDAAEFEQQLAAFDEQVFIEILEVQAGAFSETVFALGGDASSADEVQSIGLVPLGDLAIGRTAWPVDGTRIGKGAELASTDSFQVDGIDVTVDEVSTLIETGPDEIRQTLASTSTIGPITDTDWLFDYVTSMESTSSYDVTYRPQQQVGNVNLVGEVQIRMRTTLADGDFLGEIEVVVDGSIQASGNRIEWLAMSEDDRLDILSRVTRLVTDRIP